MSIDLELLVTARNYAIKLQEQLAKTRKQWQERVWKLEEAYEILESEHNATKCKYQELHRACLQANVVHDDLQKKYQRLYQLHYTGGADNGQ